MTSNKSPNIGGKVTTPDGKTTLVLPSGELGSVLLRDWISLPWSTRLIRGVYGKLTVISAEAVLGHDVNDRDSNWAILIDGATTRSVILGCQIRAVVLASAVPLNGEYEVAP